MGEPVEVRQGRATCACGWAGRWRHETAASDLAADAATHVAQVHGALPATTIAHRVVKTRAR